MKLIQITDLHIGKIGENSHNIDVRKNFLDVLEAVKNEAPDQLIISGDLCLNDGEKEVYEWIKPYLDQLPFPYHLISGNHDDPKLLVETFNLEDNFFDDQLFYKKKFENQTVLFLDTTHYYLPDLQLTWLEKELKNLDEELIIFIHHPPVNSDVPFMDNKHHLRNMEALQNVLFQYPHRIHLFCGHYHVDKIILKKNIAVYITPACYFQIDFRVPHFKVDHFRIGFRQIEVKNGTVITSVRYLEGNKIINN